MTTRLTKYLLGAQSDDSLVRREALTTLGQLRDQGLPQFLLSLSKELSDDSQHTTSRRFAGMILIKCLDFKESVARKDQLLELWVEMDMDFKSRIKQCMLDTLGSSSFEANHTAAKVIAQIYSIEIPRKEWPELFERLFANITQIDKSESLKRASLLTFHYIGKICNKELLKNEVDVVLTSMEDESIKETTSSLLSRILKFGPSIVSSTITRTPSCSDDEEQSHTTICCVEYEDGRGTNGKTVGGSTQPPVALRRSSRLSSARTPHDSAMEQQKKNSSSSSSNSKSNIITRGTKKGESQPTTSLQPSSSSHRLESKKRSRPMKNKLVSTYPVLDDTLMGFDDDDFDEVRWELEGLKISLIGVSSMFRYGPDKEERNYILSGGDTFSWKVRSSAASWIAVCGTETISVVSMATRPEQYEERVSGTPPITLTMMEAFLNLGDTSTNTRRRIARRSKTEGPFAVVCVAPGTECEAPSRAINFLKEKLENCPTLDCKETEQIAVCALKYLFGSKFKCTEIELCGSGCWRGRVRKMNSIRVKEHLGALSTRHQSIRGTPFTSTVTCL